jgi:hypothetical protein
MILHQFSKIYSTLIFYGLVDPNNKGKASLVDQGPWLFQLEETIDIQWRQQIVSVPARSIIFIRRRPSQT